MKRNTLLTLAAICMAIAGTSVAATNGGSHKHGNGIEAAKLQLDAGKKWETDGALRQAMGNIREAMAGSLHEIHENRLSNKSYGVLAQQIERQVGDVVANCKLGSKADEQLHLIISELLEGADQMAGKAKKVKRQSGAVKVIGALEKYGIYFDDAGFHPIAH